MSEGFHVRCDTCPEETDSWNHADDDIRRAVQSIPALLELVRTGAWDEFGSLRTAGHYDCVGLAPFLIEHAKHQLVLVSEYGRRELLQEQVIESGGVK